MTALELSRASARTDALFRAHHDEVYRTLLRDLGSPADAEDGTQAVFLSAFRSLERGCAPLVGARLAPRDREERRPTGLA